MARILLVEDNAMNRDMLQRQLQRQGHEVDLAEDGAQAVERSVAGCDLILMDLSIPEIDGWDATRLIKTNPATSRIPVIALTAHAMRGDREKAMAAGCDEYAEKPVDFPELFAKIAALLG